MHFTLYKFLWLLSGIFFLVCGIIIIVSPTETIASVTFLFALAICFSGVNNILSFVRWRKEEYHSTWILADGIIGIVLAFVLITNHTISVTLIPYILGVWVLLSGVLRIVNAYNLRDYGVVRWKSIFFGGLIMALMGIFLLINPIFIAVAVSFLLGTLFIIQGISSLVVLFAFWQRYL